MQRCYSPGYHDGRAALQTLLDYHAKLYRISGSKKFDLSACRMTRPVMRLTGTVPSKHQLYPLAMTYSTDRSQVSYLSRRTGPHVDTSPLYSLVSYAFEYNHKPCAHRLSTFIPYVMILNPGSLTPMIPSSSPIPASSDGVALT
jgi:hypothetical protein